MLWHFYAASCWIKTCFYKIGKLKLLETSESSIKIKIRLDRTLFLNRLLQQLLLNKDFYKETRLCNIFQSPNDKTLAKAILEIFYKVLQGSWKRSLNDPYYFQRWFSFRLLLVHFNLSKTAKHNIRTNTQ